MSRQLIDHLKQLAKSFPADPNKTYRIELGGIKITQVRPDGTEKVMMEVPPVVYPSGDYNTVVACEAALTAMVNDLTEMGAARMQPPGGAPTGGNINSGATRPISHGPTPTPR